MPPTLRSSLLAAALLFGLGACSGSGTDEGDTAGDASGDAQVDCGGCPEGKLCCPSRFEGDIPRCIDPELNPENCGGCGNLCGGACRDRACLEATSCGAGETCDDGLVCSGQEGLSRCCPVGTTFIASPSDFFGCCPDGDICGCREGMCPISVRSAKRDIHYLAPDELVALGRELLETRLATYRYRDDPTGRTRLGFIIDDGGPAHAIASDEGHVDLYGYVSLAVAALKQQADDIAQLRRELDELRRAVLDLSEPSCAPP